MRDVDLVVRNALIVTQDAQRRVIEDGLLAVAGNTIAAVGPETELAGEFNAATTIDAAGKAVFPGLLNVHTHLFQATVKGLGEDMPVEQWVQAVTFPTATAMTPDEAYLLSLVSCLENLRSGAATVLDFMYSVRNTSVQEAVLQAILDSGLRGQFTRTIYEPGAALPSTPALMQPAAEALAHARELQRAYDGAAGGRMEIGLAIGVIWGMTEEGLFAVRRVADETGMRITMHVNETPFDDLSSLDSFGRRTIPMLAHAGLLGPDFLAVHCVHVSPEDIALFAEHQVPIAYNAVSNMYLGSGIAPIMAMQEAGLAIAIATDGSGSNNCQDMLETLKFSALLQKVGAQNAAVVRAQKALDWATRGGAQAMGMGDRVGSLEVGKRADFFLLNPYTPKAVPVHDPVATLVYSAGQANIDTVVVDGRILLAGGVFQHLDEPALLRKAQAAAQALAQRAGTERLLEHRARWRPA